MVVAPALPISGACYTATQGGQEADLELGGGGFHSEIVFQGWLTPGMRAASSHLSLVDYGIFFFSAQSRPQGTTIKGPQSACEMPGFAVSEGVQLLYSTEGSPEAQGSWHSCLVEELGLECGSPLLCSCLCPHPAFMSLPSRERTESNPLKSPCLRDGS